MSDQLGKHDIGRRTAGAVVFVLAAFALTGAAQVPIRVAAMGLDPVNDRTQTVGCPRMAASDHLRTMPWPVHRQHLVQNRGSRRGALRDGDKSTINWSGSITFERGVCLRFNLNCGSDLMCY